MTTDLGGGSPRRIGRRAGVGEEVGGLFFGEQRPVVGQGVDEEKLDAEEMLLERALGKAPHVTQVDEVVAQLAFGDPIGRSVIRADLIRDRLNRKNPSQN